MIGRVACLVGLHRYRVTHWRPYWDGARRCVEGFERCQRRGCAEERAFDRSWLPKTERISR